MDNLEATHHWWFADSCLMVYIVVRVLYTCSTHSEEFDVLLNWIILVEYTKIELRCLKFDHNRERVLEISALETNESEGHTWMLVSNTVDLYYKNISAWNNKGSSHFWTINE